MKRKLTTDEKEQIRVLSARMLQKDIAAKLGRCRQTIAKIQKELGLSPHPGVTVSRETERQILRLLKKHYGSPRIAATLEIPAYVVEKIMRKHNYKKPPGIIGARYHLGVLELRGIRRAIRASEAAIARQFRVTHAWLRRFRLRMWANTGNKHWKRQRRESAIPDPSVRLVARICEEFFDGRLPAVDSDRFVATMMGAFSETTLAGQPEPVLDTFRNGLREAINTLRQSQTGWTN